MGEGRRDVQFIHPKLQNRQQKPPKTTSQASRPPSGKERGSVRARGASCFSAFSRSGVSGGFSVSIIIFASVWDRTSSSDFVRLEMSSFELSITAFARPPSTVIEELFEGGAIIFSSLLPARVVRVCMCIRFFNARNAISALQLTRRSKGSYSTAAFHGRYKAHFKYPKGCL
jgi:hypothetical protein